MNPFKFISLIKQMREIKTLFLSSIKVFRRLSIQKRDDLSNQNYRFFANVLLCFKRVVRKLMSSSLFNKQTIKIRPSLSSS